MAEWWWTGPMANVGICETPITIDIVNGYAETITVGKEAEQSDPAVRKIREGSKGCG